LHHLPAGPPLSARLSAAVRRLVLRFRAPTPARRARASRRFALGLGCTVVVTGLLLAVPVVSGAGGGSTPVALDSSSTSSSAPGRGEPPVVMGIDGLDGLTPPAAPETSASRSAAARSAGAPGTPPATGGPSASARSAPGTAAGSAGTRSTTPGSASAAPDPAVAPGPSTPGRSPESGPSASSGPATAASQVTPQALAAQVGALVVRARDEAGCVESALAAPLTGLAQEHSADMRDRGYVGLIDPDGGSLLSRGASTGAVARGPADPRGVVAGWLAVPVDRAALLDCTATRLGVGVAEGAGGP
jgi:uncharacterized protein YkwD